MNIYLGKIVNLINNSLEEIPEDAEFEDYGEGSLRYALVAYLEEALDKQIIPEWFHQFVE
ncbi:MAG: hypothetical protein ACR2M9_04775 [Cyanophyceae cyanobacterium]